MARGCPEEKVDKLKKFDGECHNCGVRGHMARDCWHREVNKIRGLRSGGAGIKIDQNGQEQVNTAVGSKTNVEYILAGIELPKKY